MARLARVVVPGLPHHVTRRLLPLLRRPVAPHQPVRMLPIRSQVPHIPMGVEEVPHPHLLTIHLNGRVHRNLGRFRLLGLLGRVSLRRRLLRGIRIQQPVRKVRHRALLQLSAR